MLNQFRQESEHLRYQLAHPAHLATHLSDWLAEEDVRLGFSLIGGTVIWAIYFSSVHALNSLACRWIWLSALAGGSGLKLVQMLAAVLALVLIATFSYNAHHIWRNKHRKTNADTSQPRTPMPPGQLEQRVAAPIPFEAPVILLLNIFYLVTILITWAPIVMRATCAA